MTNLLFWCASCRQKVRSGQTPEGWAWTATNENGGWSCKECEVQTRLGQEAIAALPPRIRKHYAPQFQLIPDTGRFVGLSCKSCQNWREYGHKPDCPVLDLELL